MTDIEIELDSDTIRPGEPVTGRVLLSPKKEVVVKGLIVEIVGKESSRASAHTGHHGHHGHHHQNDDRTYFETRDVVKDKKVLSIEFQAAATTHAFEFGFELPNDAPPSYKGNIGSVEYSVSAQADIPWAIDPRAKKPVTVLSGSSTMLGGPIDLMMGDSAGQGRSGYGDGSKPGFHIHLPKNSYRPREAMTGTITIFNPTDKRVRKVTLCLYGVEHSVAQGYRYSQTRQKFDMDVPVDESCIGRAIPFTMAVPPEAVPSHNSELIRLQWVLQANLDVAWGFDTKAETAIEIGR